MKVLNTIILVVVISLAIGSGMAKIMLIPEDVAFFTSVGLSKTLIVLFGAFQLISAFFIILKKWRNVGAMILGITFGLSTILIFLSGKILFGLFSILPLVLILLVVKIKSK